MRRLIEHLEKARATHQRNGERGAIAVITAVSLVVLLLAAAIAIDVGLIYEERAQLQTASDAAALAIAQQCATGGSCEEDDNWALAKTYAQANMRDSTITVDAPDVTGNTVRVTTHALDSDGVGSLALNFGFVTDQDEADVGATATASWEAPYRGTAALPFIFSRCDFHLGAGAQVLQMHSNGNGQGGGTGNNSASASSGDTAGNVTVMSSSNLVIIPAANDKNNGKSDPTPSPTPTPTTETDDSGVNTEDCPFKSSSGLNLPGGFGIFDSEVCEAVVEIGKKVYSDPGNSVPSACETKLATLKDKTILLPIYTDLGGTGDNAWYRPDGWAAFKLLGWNFPSTSAGNTKPEAACTNPCTGVIGEFVRFVSLDEGQFELPDEDDSQPTDYGAVVVGLKE